MIDNLFQGSLSLVGPTTPEAPAVEALPVLDTSPNLVQPVAKPASPSLTENVPSGGGLVPMPGLPGNRPDMPRAPMNGIGTRSVSRIWSVVSEDILVSQI